MKKVKIMAVRRTCYPDLMERYENPIEHACDTEIGRVWVSENAQKPEGFCNAAWECMASFVKTLAEGGGSFREEKGIYPAYHMSKAHWLTVALDGTVDKDKIKFLMDMSYDLTRG